MAADTQNALAALRKFKLERDDETDPGGRIYKDQDGNIYHSVTRILSATSDNTGLERWAAWVGEEAAATTRRVAATRGTLTHNNAEYLLKSAAKLARATANKRGLVRFDDNGLAHIPAPVTQWALKRIHPKLPSAGWSAAGFSRSLTSWIVENVEGIHACEFSIHHPAGFAGTCDGLIQYKGKLTAADWKTTGNTKQIDSDHSYVAQVGAYALGLEHLTGIQAEAGVIVLARRTGQPQVVELSPSELQAAKNAFMARVERYYEALEQSPA